MGSEDYFGKFRLSNIFEVPKKFLQETLKRFYKEMKYQLKIPFRNLLEADIRHSLETPNHSLAIEKNSFVVTMEEMLIFHSYIEDK